MRFSTLVAATAVLLVGKVSSIANDPAAETDAEEAMAFSDYDFPPSAASELPFQVSGDNEAAAAAEEEDLGFLDTSTSLMDEEEIGPTGATTTTTTTVAAAVTVASVSVRKCCPDGHVGLESRSEVVRCVARESAATNNNNNNNNDNGNTWGGKFSTFTEEGMAEVVADRVDAAGHGVPACRAVSYLFPVYFPSQEFSVSVDDGNMRRVTGHVQPNGTYCVDRFVLGENLTSTFHGAVVCAEDTWLPPPMTMTTTTTTSAKSHDDAHKDDHDVVYKCCLGNQILDLAEKTCVDPGTEVPPLPITRWADGTRLESAGVSFRDDTLETFSGLCSQLLPVPGNTSDLRILDTTHLYSPEDRQVLNSLEYCADWSIFNGTRHLSAIVCVEETLGDGPESSKERFEAECSSGQGLCVMKCCGQGQAMVVDEKGLTNCEPVAEEMLWKPVFHAPVGHGFRQVPVSETEIKILDGFTPVCPGGAVPGLDQIPSRNPNETFFLLASSSSLHSSLYSMVFPAPQYCVDTILRSRNGSAVEIAVLCFPEEENGVHFVYSVFLVVSAGFLALTLVLGFLLPDGGRMATWTLLSHVACLLVAISLLTWLQIGGSLEDEVACVVVACVMYYSFLSAFLWLNVMSFDIWYTLSGRGGANDEDPLWLEIFHTAPHVDRVADEDDEDRDDSCGETAPMKPQKNLPAAKGRAGRRYLKRCVYAFGIPGLMTGVMLVFQLVESIPESFLTYPINPDRRCWFRSDWTILAYFYGPLALVLGANFVFFVLTSYFLIAHRKNTKNLNMRESQKKKFWLFVKLFLVMGVGWTMEVISWKAGSVASFYVTDAVNSLTGIFVFIVFILRRKTMKDLRERFCSKRRASTPGSSETRTTTASSSSSSNKHGANLRSVFATKKSYSPRRDLTNSALPYIDDDQEKLSGNVEKISIKPVGD